jgi:hypothetical protein
VCIELSSLWAIADLAFSLTDGLNDFPQVAVDMQRAEFFIFLTLF